MFCAFAQVHPEDYSHFIGWHYDPQDVSLLRRLAEEAPGHNLRLQQFRDLKELDKDHLSKIFIPLLTQFGDLSLALKSAREEPLVDNDPELFQRLFDGGSVDPYGDARILLEVSEGSEEDFHNYFQLVEACTDFGTPGRAGEAFRILQENTQPGLNRLEWRQRFEHLIRQVGVDGLDLALVDSPSQNGTAFEVESEQVRVGVTGFSFRTRVPGWLFRPPAPTGHERPRLKRSGQGPGLEPRGSEDLFVLIPKASFDDRVKAVS